MTVLSVLEAYFMPLRHYNNIRVMMVMTMMSARR